MTTRLPVELIKNITGDRLVGSDGSGNVGEITIGAGLSLTGSSLAASGGGGDVNKVGTPVDNQVGVWTGDGTIEGDAALTFNTTTNLLGVGSSGTGSNLEMFGATSGSTTLVPTAAAGSTTLTLPAATDTLVGKATTDTFTNKSGNISQWTNDSGYITATLTNEEVQDIVGGMLVGTQTLITVTYQDGTNDIDFVVDNDLSNYSNATSAFITAASSATLTNKTFDANGTGNSLSNVDVADLANGTDGELITWDATGAPATVATGTSGQVLTSNGAGAAPTFQAAAGGSSTESFVMAVSDETALLTTGTAKLTMRIPYAFTLSAVRASVTTAPTGSVITIDINENGTTILSTKITIDATEKTSVTAAVAAVISDTSLADDAEITVDIDTVGSTIAGAGLKVALIGTQT